MAQSEKLMKGEITAFATEMKKMINSKDMRWVGEAIDYARAPARACLAAYTCIYPTTQGPNVATKIDSQIDPNIHSQINFYD